MKELAAQVEQSILARGLFRKGQSILVAVSGGMDSMVLLHMLTQLAKTHRWHLVVAHFNHQLRGRSSNADERLVARTAKKWRLPFIADRADVLRHSREYKLSLEMAARKLRHEFLVRSAKHKRINHIALAHHADDQVELFFVRLLRGAGGEGLAGMKWQSPSPADHAITLCRPLLDQTRSALQKYAEAESVAFREDATNSSLDIQRNRIRHELLPLLAKKYQPAITRVLLRQMEILSAETDLVSHTASDWLGQKKRPAFDTLPLAVQRRCLQLQLLQNGLTANFDLIEQLRETPGRQITIAPNQIVFRNFCGVLTAQKNVPSSFDLQAISAHLQDRAGEMTFANTKVIWRVEKMPSGTFRAPKQRVNCECFDAAKVGVDIVLRHWQPGDRFQPIGLAAPVKLQDLFTNEKISRVRRHELLVAATGDGNVFWVEGLRLAERFKLDKETRYQLKWRWKRVC